LFGLAGSDTEACVPTLTKPVWFACGVRTPFAKVDGALAELDALELSVPVARAMLERLGGARPDFAVWGAVAPNLAWSNSAREVLMDAGLDARIPAFSTVMACSTSMVGAIEAAGLIQSSGGGLELALVGGAESMSRVQLGSGSDSRTGSAGSSRRARSVRRCSTSRT
jgi:acetyl-CoA C-acetyltransferase